MKYRRETEVIINSFVVSRSFALQIFFGLKDFAYWTKIRVYLSRNQKFDFRVFLQIFDSVVFCLWLFKKNWTG